MSDHDPQILVRQMRQAAKKAVSYIDGLTREEFLADSRTQEAVALNLLVIGEAAARLSARHADFTNRLEDVPWRQIQGMRNRIAHGYIDVDMRIVWDTASAGLPELLRSLPDIGPAMDS